MIDIKSILGKTLLSVPILKDAVSHEELMVSDYVQLRWDSDNGEILPAGAYVEYDGERYSLLEPYHPTRQNELVYRYAPQFQSRIVRWQKIIVPVYAYNEDGVTIKSRELDWTFTGTPADAMFMIQQTLRNELGEEWNISLGEDLPETMTITSQSSSVWSVLSDLAEQCETEWWAEKSAMVLHLGKCEHSAPITLEAGRNVKMPSSIRNAEEYYTRFYAFGSTRNITQSDGVVQGSIINKRLTLDPIKYPHGYKDIKGHFEDGVYVSDLAPEEVLVKSLYFDEVYPSSQLVISNARKRMRYRHDENDKKIRIGGTDENPIYEQYAIWYFQIPDFKFTENLIIEGLALSVAFRSGQLRGREFELAYHSEDKKVADNADVDETFSVMAGEYEIIFDESNGMMIPSADYLLPSDGDEITLFNIEMPEEYKHSAYEKLEEELDKELGRLVQDNNAYEFDSNPVAFYNDDTSVRLGQRVTFINGDKSLSTRVQMVEKHIDYPYEQKIRVGNEIVKGSRQQLRDEVRNIGEEVSRMERKSESYGVIQRDHSRDLMITMGRFFAMQDTIKMLQNAVEGYTGGINPVTIETMALLVGNEALQFRFTRSREDLTPLEECPLTYDPETKQMHADPCALIHLTYQIDDITAQNVRTAKEYWSWDMEEWPSRILTEEDKDKGFYVYAVVENNEAKKGGIGSYSLEELPIGMRDKIDSEGVLYLLVGILNQEYAGTREFLPLYGFTQILPAQITTDLIRSADGSCYFDLARNEIGGTIKFKAGSEGELNIGTQNMLRNSGFTGDYLSEPLADQTVMDTAKKLYSDPLDHWEATEGVKVVDLADVSASGYGIHIEASYDSISQTLYHKTIAGESYVFSFKAKADFVESAVEVTCGGLYEHVTVTSEWKRYSVKITATETTDVFTLEGTGYTICELQLERGTIATHWSPSYLDNSSDRTYYQALRYLQDALKGSTVIDGGLVLTNLIQVGEMSNQSEFVPKAGMNGLNAGETVDGVNDGDNTPAFWAGGTIDDAVELIRRIRNGETDLSGLADFVVTHGGMAVLRNLKLFADSGALGGLIVTDRGLTVDTDSEGSIEFTKRGIVARQKDWSFTEIGTCGSQALLVMGKDAAGGQCYPEDNEYKIAAQINAADKGHAIHSLSGLFAGLRPNIRAVSESAALDALDHTVIVDNYAQMTLSLPSSPRTGQTYKIIHRTDKAVTLSSQYVIIDVTQSYSEVSTISGRGVTELTYYNQMWYAELK